ncbi:MAG: hypothetical protein ABIH35_01240 [Patescibacteria group bacterium]
MLSLRTLIQKISSDRKYQAVAVVAVAVVLVIIGTFFFSGENLRGSVIGTIDTDSYQAIHLDTGETYFGKVSKINDEAVSLTDVYYFLEGDKTKLVKRGREAHAPQDTLTINRDRILTTENLQETSPVVKAIRKYQESKK